MARSDFSITRRADGTLAFVGELDAGNADALCAALDVGAAPLCLDLSGVTFIDSSALHVLLAVQNSKPADFAIVDISLVVCRLLELTGTASILLPAADADGHGLRSRARPADPPPPHATPE